MSNCDADTFLIKPMDKAEFARKKTERDAQKRTYWQHTLLPVSVQDALIHAADPGHRTSQFQRLMLIAEVVKQARLEHPKFFK